MLSMAASSIATAPYALIEKDYIEHVKGDLAGLLTSKQCVKDEQGKHSRSHVIKRSQ